MPRLRRLIRIKTVCIKILGISDEFVRLKKNTDTLKLKMMDLYFSAIFSQEEIFRDLLATPTKTSLPGKICFEKRQVLFFKVDPL